MRKRNGIILLIIISSLISAIVSPSVGAVMEEGFPYFPSSSLPRQAVGSGASEWETVDTWEVHPGSGRWEITNENSFNDVIDETIYVCNDTGDGTSDAIGLRRGLRSLDGTVIYRFKFDTNSTSTSANDMLRLGISSTHEVAAGYPDQSVFFRVESVKMSNESSTTYLQYFDRNFDPVHKQLTANDNERLYANLWYKLRIDFDLLKSEFRFRCYFENNTRVFDYYWHEIGSIRPNIFDATKLYAYMLFRSYTIGKYVEYMIDYVNAPFKEREWVQSDTPSDSDWLEDRWDIAYAQDDISDYSKWNYTVPYLDSASISIKLEWEDAIELVNPTDTMQSIISIHAVDALNGTHYEIMRAYMGTDRAAAAVWANRIFVYNGDDSKSYSYSHTWTTGTSLPDCRMYCSFEVQEDRSVVDLKVRFFYDLTNNSAFTDFVIEEDVDDWVDNPSQEFVLHLSHRMSFTGNTEGKIVVEKFDPLSQDRFAEVHKGLPESPEGIQEGGWDPFAELQKGITSAFSTIIDGLGAIVEGIGTTISSAIGLIQGWLETAATAVTDAIGNIEGWLNTIGTTISEAIAAIAADIWSAFSEAASTFIDDVITATGNLASDVAGLIDTLIQAVLPYLTALAEDFAGLLVDVLEFVLPLLLALAEYIWGVIAAVVFWVWDELGLPDLLAIVEVLLTGFIQLVNGLPNFLTLLGTAIVVLAYLIPSIGLVLFFGLPLAQGSIGGYIDAMLRYMGFDITFGIGIFGNHVYVPAVAVWLVISLGTVLSGTTYAGFF